LEAIHQPAGESGAQTRSEPHDKVCRAVFVRQQVGHSPRRQDGHDKSRPKPGSGYRTAQGH
jgi:hypothetical protein